ncbi:hypothetical protein [Leptospira kirschneri]|nr:hypothetical protein [Leptospira kirschneri]
MAFGTFAFKLSFQDVTQAEFKSFRAQAPQECKLREAYVVM